MEGNVEASKSLLCFFLVDSCNCWHCPSLAASRSNGTMFVDTVGLSLQFYNIKMLFYFEPSSITCLMKRHCQFSSYMYIEIFKQLWQCESSKRDWQPLWQFRKCFSLISSVSQFILQRSYPYKCQFVFLQYQVKTLQNSHLRKIQILAIIFNFINLSCTILNKMNFAICY